MRSELLAVDLGYCIKYFKLSCSGIPQGVEIWNMAGFPEKDWY